MFNLQVILSLLSFPVRENNENGYCHSKFILSSAAFFIIFISKRLKNHASSGISLSGRLLRSLYFLLPPSLPLSLIPLSFVTQQRVWDCAVPISHSKYSSNNRRIMIGPFLKEHNGVAHWGVAQCVHTVNCVWEQIQWRIVLAGLHLILYRRHFVILNLVV